MLGRPLHAVGVQTGGDDARDIGLDETAVGDDQAMRDSEGADFHPDLLGGPDPEHDPRRQVQRVCLADIHAQ